MLKCSSVLPKVLIKLLQIRNALRAFLLRMWKFSISFHYLKLQHRCFPVDIAKFLKTSSSFEEHLRPAASVGGLRSLALCLLSFHVTTLIVPMNVVLLQMFLNWLCKKIKIKNLELPSPPAIRNMLLILSCHKCYTTISKIHVKILRNSILFISQFASF